MPVTRRSFLSGLLFGAPALLTVRASAHSLLESLSATPAPLTINHNADGRFLISEGKTLLASIKFPSQMASVTGSLPTDIAPASAAGSRLIEPQPLYFYPSHDSLTFHTFLSVPLDVVESKKAELQIKAKAANKQIAEYEFEYSVQRGPYRTSSFSLSRNFSSPSTEIAERMRSDFETMVAIYKLRTHKRWGKPFILPVGCAHRNNFGDRRIVNGTKRYRHAGLDFNAPSGTPVRAINDGEIVLSTEQWTPGQTICIDHGGGVFSKYMHLSQRYARKGDRVSRGDVIALSGQSGGQRPGPHLHLDTVINGTHVDPMDFMRAASQFVLLESGE